MIFALVGLYTGQRVSCFRLQIGKSQMDRFIHTCIFVLITAIGGASNAFAQIDTLAIFRNAIDARNRGDLDGMMEFFAPDAVREDGSCQPPCVGLAAVRRSMEINIADHFRADLTAVEGKGDTVTGSALIYRDALRAQGIDHRTTTYIVRFRGDKIVHWSSPLPAASLPVSTKQ